MKFSRMLKRMLVPEWSDFYLNYSILKKLLTPAKITDELYLKSSIDGNEGEISNLCQEDLDRLNKFHKKFEEVIMKELNKVSGFYRMKMKELLRTWRKIKLNAVLVKRSKQKPDYDERKSLLKNAFQLYYKELRLVSDFISVNLEGFKKIFKKFKKHSKKFDPKNNLKAIFEERIRDVLSYLMNNAKIHIHYHRESILNLISHVETDYLEIFYSRGDGRKQGQDELRKINQGKQVSDQETFFFGFFLGLCVSIIFIIKTVSFVNDLNIDGYGTFKEIFPLFRGMGLVILYIWLLAWNVYGWTNNNINYKLIFSFSYHYSTVSEILQRAAVFTAVFLTIFLWYILSMQDMGYLTYYLNLFPPNLLPMIIWLLFLGYMLFPSMDYFNGQGRLYTAKLLKDVLLSPFRKNSFRVFWATDQLASFVVPMMDFEYFFCFYTSEISTCGTYGYSNSAVLIAIIPLMLRMIQCGRLMYDNKVIVSSYLFNGLKYFISVITVSMSYMYGVTEGNPIFLLWWIVLATLVTVFSYYWDLKIDWGFLVKDSKYPLLRNDLSYANQKIYYYAMISNLLFRVCWILSISPAVIDQFSQPELITALVGLGEILRRSVWNFLRVEKEHIANCGSFKAVSDYLLPYDQIEINFDEKYLFRGELNQIQEADEEEDNFDISLTKQASSTQENFEQAAQDDDESISPARRKKVAGVKKITSLLNIAAVDVNTLKMDSKEIELIKEEVKQFKDYITKKALTFKVVSFVEWRNSQIETIREPLLSRLVSTDSKNMVKATSRPS